MKLNNEKAKAIDKAAKALADAALINEVAVTDLIDIVRAYACKKVRNENAKIKEMAVNARQKIETLLNQNNDTKL